LIRSHPSGAARQSVLQTKASMMLKKSPADDGSADPNPALSIGQRERNKRDKLLRIKNAARELFVSKGYDDTTTREIAIRAGVGMGTVFTYADNKRDLLFLIANEDLAEATRRAAADLSPKASILTNLLTIFRDHYEYFAQQPELSKLMLREMLFYDSGEQANRFKATREQFISLIDESVRLAKDRNEIVSPEDSRFIGWVIFCLYQVEIRRWLAEQKLNVADGMATLERAIRVVMSGLGAKDPAKSPSRGRVKGT
jgi:AcrR family transcriptional regulator